MNIIQRAKAFVQSLRELGGRSAWNWRRCPKCGNDDTVKHGTYKCRPWFLDGRRTVTVQRHKCNNCSSQGKTFTYSEKSPLLVRGSWYAREVRRYSIDLWQHGRSSLRRSAEFVRSLVGRQERWQFWRPLDEPPGESEQCRLNAGTLHRWLDRAGIEAQRTVERQLEGVASSGQVGTDGLWAKMRGGTKRVVLVLVDSVSGLIWPPVVVEGEESQASWKRLFQRASQAGLDLQKLRGVTSDGATGLLGYVNRELEWVNQQRCVFHIWRNLSGALARQVSEAGKGLVGEAGEAVRKQARRELVRLVRGVLDAGSEEQARAGLVKLAAHRLGAGLAQMIEEHLDAALMHLSWYNQGLMRVGPEWVWRDFRLRVSRGRNHGSDERLERASLVWGVYENFTPAQRRSERKRHYRRPGKSRLEAAGSPQYETSYLDALSV